MCRWAAAVLPLPPEPIASPLWHPSLLREHSLNCPCRLPAALPSTGPASLSRPAWRMCPPAPRKSAGAVSSSAGILGLAFRSGAAGMLRGQRCAPLPARQQRARPHGSEVLASGVLEPPLTSQQIPLLAIWLPECAAHPWVFSFFTSTPLPDPYHLSPGAPALLRQPSGHPQNCCPGSYPSSGFGLNSGPKV